MGKKLTVYLIDGNDNGPRTIEIGNWSGKAIHSPRSSLTKLMSRDEFTKPGVYLLKSDPKEAIYSERIYIGEAENVGKRLKQHLQNGERDFKECIFFISKDELLTKSHIKYIESRLVCIAREAQNAEIENGNTPTESTLSEADISDMEYFIDQIRLVLPTAGYVCLVATTGTHDSSLGTGSVTPESKEFSIKNKKFQARMTETSDGFLVAKGSEANPEESPSIADGWSKLREKLLKNDIWKLVGDKYVFQSNYVFSSPSAASSVILGRQSAGPIEWIDADGKTYKDYQTETLGDSEEKTDSDS